MHNISSSVGKIKLKFLVPLITFFVIAAFLGVGLTLNPRDLPSNKINKIAPPFTLDLLSVPSQQFSPNDLLGQRWILNVWASWCVACRTEHPILNEIANRTDIPLIGLNYKDKPADAKKWLAERGNPYYKIPMDINGNAGIDWGVYGVPETFVIDKNGLIIYKHTGPIDAQTVEKMMSFFIDNTQQNTSENINSITIPVEGI